jgi:hypothetical protein
VAVLLDQTCMFESNMARVVVENGHKTNLRHNEIGLYVGNHFYCSRLDNERNWEVNKVTTIQYPF